MNARTVRKAFLPVTIIIIAVFIARFMMVHRITPGKVTVTETVVPVEVKSASFEKTRIRIPAQGTVSASTQVSLRPEVNGRVTKISSNLAPGGMFRKGDIMFWIDDRDYRIIEANRKQGLAAAELALKQEQARTRVAEREWNLLETSIDWGDADKELALRLPQLKQAEATVEAARKNLEKAQLDVSRCIVHAPFNGIIIRENVDVGQMVSSASESVLISGTDEYWVQLSIPVENIRFIAFPDKEIEGSAVVITQVTGNGAITRSGHVVRLLGDMMESGRMARLLVSIPDPKYQGNGDDLPLLLGSFVNAEIMGRELDHVIRLPRSALHVVENGNTNTGDRTDSVWIMNGDGRLSVCPVTVAWRTDNDVLIHNSLQEGDRLILSTISTPIEGMKLTQIKGESDNAKVIVDED